MSFTIHGFIPVVRRVLLSGRCRMLEALEGCFYIAWHGDVNVAFIIMPVEFEATKLRTTPVCGDGVLGSEDSLKVLGVFLPTYLIPKSSTMRQKVMGRVVCMKRPGMRWDW